MKIFRLILAFALVLLALQFSPTLAWRNGYVPITTNNDRVTINAVNAYANLVKGWGIVFNPFTCASPPCTDSNGYLTQAPSTQVLSNPSLIPGYYGTYTNSWSGTAAIKDNTGLPAIFTTIAPQGAVFEMGNVSSGDHAPSSYTYQGQVNGGTTTNTGTVLQYGWNIQSIQNDGSGHIQINTKTNYVASCTGYSSGIAQGTDQNGNTGNLVSISGANTNTGANGTWAFTCAASSIVLTGSTFTNAQAGAGGTGIFAAQNLSIIFLAQGTWTSWTNFFWGETGVVGNGHYTDPTYVSQLQALMNPNANCAANHDCGWIRFMDLAQGQTDKEKDYAERVTVNSLTWNRNGSSLPYYRANYLSSSSNSAVTNGGSDQYTTGDAATSVWSGSAYIDGAIVQGVVDVTNSTVSPTLNVGGHGAKPILSYQDTLPTVWVILSGGTPSPGTDTLSFTFQVAGNPSWFNGGSSCSVTYTTQAGDGTLGTLAGNLDTWFGGGTVGANTPITCLSSSKVQHGNPEDNVGPMLYPPSAQGGRFSASYTSGPAIVSIGTIRTSAISTGTSNIATFRYNYLEDGWEYGGATYNFGYISPGVPFEYAADLCNQVGCNVWWNFSTNSSSFVQSATQNFATNLSSGLKFGFEVGNEVWNCFGPQPCPYWKTLGTALGASPSGNASVFNYTGLRTIQYYSVASAAWSGQGRAASDLYTFIMAQADDEGVNGNYDSGQLKASSFNTSTNTFVASYGALGGGAVSTNPTTQGNRPVDVNAYTGIGIAPYWGSPWWGSVGTSITGTVAGNAPWLQAQLDYANGLTATAFSEITNTFNGTTARTDGTTNVGQLLLNAGSGSLNISSMYTNMEAIAAEYDSYRTGASLPKVKRFDYEGAPQWAFGNNATNGTNSASDATALSVLTTRIGTTLAWNVSAYTLDGTNNAGELAQQILTFSQAWKNSGSYANLIDNSLYRNLVSISGANREVHGAQYGYDANTWGLYPGDFHFNNPYQNYNAIATQNAGN